MYGVLQQQAIDAAKAELQDKPWYRGICLDCLPEEHKIVERGVVWATEQLTMDTYYWDGDK